MAPTRLTGAVQRCRHICEAASREEAGSDACSMPCTGSVASTPRASLSGSGPVSDAVYLRHLSRVLDERLDDIHPADFQL